MTVLGHVAMDLTLNTRKLTDESGINGSKISLILKHTFKIRFVYELKEDDIDHYLEFCVNV